MDIDLYNLIERVTALESKALQVKLQPTEQENLKNNLFEGIIDTVPSTAIATNLKMIWKKDEYDIPTTNQVSALITAALPSTGTLYVGKIQGGGAGFIFPTGWTMTNPATGKYKVTHNLGTTLYSVVATSFVIAGFSSYVYITLQQTNDFTVETYANGGLNNCDLCFMVST